MRRLWNTTSRRIGSSLWVIVLTLVGLAAPAAAADQVSFTLNGTGVVTGVTHLPGGLTQVDISSGLMAGFTAGSTVPAWADGASAPPCLVIDTDVGLDDKPACEAADRWLRGRPAVWVDLPTDASPSPSYAPTAEMIGRLAQTGMPGVLRAALRLDPAQWLGTRLWDDTAALYLLEPRDFAANGAHLEPALNEETWRQRLVRAINEH